MSREKILEMQASAWDAMCTLFARIDGNVDVFTDVMPQITMWAALHSAASMQLATMPPEVRRPELVFQLKEIRLCLQESFRFLTVIPTSLRTASRVLDELIEHVGG